MASKNRISRVSVNWIAMCFILFGVALPGRTWADSCDEDVQKRLTGVVDDDYSAATARLANGGNDAVAALVRALPGKSPKQREYIASWIASNAGTARTATFYDSDLKEFYRRVRNDDDFVVRREGVDAFRGLTRPLALRELEEWGASDPDEIVRQQATEIAGESPTMEIRFLQEANPR